MEKKDKRKVLATVHDFNIMSDTIYEVVGKHDGSAPQAFQDANIAKAPFKENSTYIVCPYDNMGQVYDTGFYARSRCYQGMPRAEVERQVKERVENIMKPYEDFVQKNVEQTNFDFWDGMSAQIYMEKVFNTANPLDLFQLYIGIHSCMLTPKDMDGDPRFMGSMFCIVEKEGVRDFVKQRDINKMEIGYRFMNSMKKGGKERQAVIDLLLYIGVVTRPDITEDDYYIGSLSNWMNGRATNVDYLVDIWDRSMEKDFKEILEFNRIINIMMKRGRMAMTPEGLRYNNQIVGPDPRTSAEIIAKRPEMADTKIALINDYTSMDESDEEFLLSQLEKKSADRKAKKELLGSDEAKPKED